MRNTLKIECLVHTLQRVVEAKAEHDTARDKYHDGGGQSWGYYGNSYVQAMEDAAEEFGKRLDEYIEDVVEKKLNARLGGTGPAK